MQQVTTSTAQDEALAIVHIGMLLASWDNDTLPNTLTDVHNRIFSIFGVKIWKEPNIITARNKIIAVIENSQTGGIKH